MAGNTIELWGCVQGEPELRVTPAGNAVLRIVVDAGREKDSLTLAIVMTGDTAKALGARLRTGVSVRVKGSLRPARRRSRSGVMEEVTEVEAQSIEIEVEIENQ